MSGFRPRFTNSIPVRYGEVDQQGVVFNAHYLAYCDDTLERWVRTFGDVRALGWDMMLVKATVEWQGSAGHLDTIDVGVAVTRYGGTSFTLGYRGTVDGQPLFTAEIVYVSVRFGGREPYETPAQMRALLGDAVEAPC
jgi:acyl-CoA thioester hydrolase